MKDAQAEYLASMRTEYLTSDEYDDARDRLGEIARRRAEAILKSAPAADDPIAELPKLAKIRRAYLSFVTEKKLLNDLDRVATTLTARAWSSVDAKLAADDEIAAMMSGMRIAASSPAVSDAQLKQLDELKAKIAREHGQKAGGAGERLGLRAVHEGIAHWADPKAPMTALPLVRHALGSKRVMGKFTGCKDARDIVSGATGGTGGLEFQIDVNAQACTPQTQRREGYETYTWDEKVAYQASEPV